MELRITNISKNYAKLQALSDLSLVIRSGGVFGLVGPNGAGKSTLMKILATLVQPTSGTVFWDDIDILRRPNQLRRVLGYLPQDVALYPNLTAPQFLSYIASLKSLKGQDAKRQINELLETFHLSECRKQRLAEYSGGMRQRVGIACALLGDPQVIIVDEPSVGLDPEERIGLRDLLCELAKTRIAGVCLARGFLVRASRRRLAAGHGDTTRPLCPGGQSKLDTGCQCLGAGILPALGWLPLYQRDRRIR